LPAQALNVTGIYSRIMKFLIFFLVGFITFLSLCVFVPVQNQLYISPERLVEKPVVSNEDLSSIFRCISALNEKNAQIHSIKYNQFKIKTSENPIRLVGFIAYEKPQKFRMMIYSILVQESDIGSNDEIFWFWSRRMRNPSLYWAKHEDVNKTRLKPLFRPDWIMDSLGINFVENAASVSRDGKYYKILERTRGVGGKEFLKITLINPQELRIVGIYLHDYSKLIASTEIKDIYLVNGYAVPKRIVMTWHEENVYIEWNMPQPQINLSFEEGLWEKPSSRNEVNLGKELTYFYCD